MTSSLDVFQADGQRGGESYSGPALFWHNRTGENFKYIFFNKNQKNGLISVKKSTPEGGDFLSYQQLYSRKIYELLGKGRQKILSKGKKYRRVLNSSPLTRHSPTKN